MRICRLQFAVHFCRRECEAFASSYFGCAHLSFFLVSEYLCFFASARYVSVARRACRLSTPSANGSGERQRARATRVKRGARSLRNQRAKCVRALAAALVELRRRRRRRPRRRSATEENRSQWFDGVDDEQRERPTDSSSSSGAAAAAVSLLRVCLPTLAATAATAAHRALRPSDDTIEIPQVADACARALTLAPSTSVFVACVRVAA